MEHFDTVSCQRVLMDPIRQQRFTGRFRGWQRELWAFLALLGSTGLWEACTVTDTVIEKRAIATICVDWTPIGP